jgi:hypothetical protein
VNIKGIAKVAEVKNMNNIKNSLKVAHFCQNNHSLPKGYSAFMRDDLLLISF